MQKYRLDTFHSLLQHDRHPKREENPMRTVLRDLRRKRPELDAAIESILQSRPDLRDDEQST
jgi:hypothetical protein